MRQDKTDRLSSDGRQTQAEGQTEKTRTKAGERRQDETRLD